MRGCERRWSKRCPVTARGRHSMLTGEGPLQTGSVSLPPLGQSLFQIQCTQRLRRSSKQREDGRLAHKVVPRETWTTVTKPSTSGCSPPSLGKYGSTSSPTVESIAALQHLTPIRVNTSLIPQVTTLYSHMKRRPAERCTSAGRRVNDWFCRPLLSGYQAR